MRWDRSICSFSAIALALTASAAAAQQTVQGNSGAPQPPSEGAAVQTSDAAIAQPAAQQATSEASPGGLSPAAAGAPDIVVTGSRISRRDYVAQSPIVTASREALETTGAPTIDKALLTLPQFQPGQGGFTNSSAGGQGVGLASLNLRSLGPQRTLVLLGSGLVDHSQKITVAARATAEKKTVGQRS